MRKDTCKITYKKIYGIVSAVLLGLITFSCSQQPIFWAIEQEIKLAEPTIKGNVYSVVRCGDYLYAANGNVYRKHRTSERGWEKIPSPPKSAAYLASSSTHVYALGTDKNDCQVYVLNGNTWQEVSGASGKANEVVIFDNGDGNAYVRVGGSVKPLNGTTTLALPSWAATNGAGTKTVATAAGSSGDYFSDTRAFCSAGSKLYSADGKTIKWGTTNADLSHTSVQTSENITCLIHIFDGTNGYLIAGTKKGLEKITLESGEPKSTGNLESNAKAALGESEIFCAAFFRDAANYAIYTGTGKASLSKYNALWGYYPSRGNWNYE